MNAHQIVLASALAVIRTVLTETLTSNNAINYWTSILNAADSKVNSFTIGHKGGDVQAQFSDPLAYILVPFYGHGLYNSGLSGKPKGRTYEETMRQLVCIGVDNLTSKSADILRVSCNLSVQDALKAKEYASQGLTHTFLKNTSGNKEFRAGLENTSRTARVIRAVPEFKLEQIENEI